MCPLQTFIAPATGRYLFIVAGAQGGNTTAFARGGFGATVRATALLQQGANVTIIVGGQGSSDSGDARSQPGAGGGGLSAVYTNDQTSPTIVAGILFSLLDIAIFWRSIVGLSYLFLSMSVANTIDMTAEDLLAGTFRGHVLHHKHPSTFIFLKTTLHLLKYNPIDLRS